MSSSSSDSTVAAATAEHGKYLVKSMGCGDCHTPWVMGPQGPAPDMSRMLSGHPAGMHIDGPAKLAPPWMWGGDMSMTAFSGPWGVSFAANLTPDSATGLGTWSQDTFMAALRIGKHKGTGRPILPPMPWPSFTNLTDRDLASIYMFLRTIPPITNQVQDPIPGMMGMGGPPPGAPGAPGGMQAPGSPIPPQGLPPLPPGAPPLPKK
ncbi:MAG: diheme cytochrome c-553 [Bacteroidota bacterium]|nr:diheme cytochrome c-553 [Bacteroidota bacterium]MDP4233617.1 diheme cytochrome c-553 [Bacteroidota bacterium]MDP4288545.1 diheme cytochrome c-553 [Bacteroidota bacterium]